MADRGVWVERMRGMALAVDRTKGWEEQLDLGIGRYPAIHDGPTNPQQHTSKPSNLPTPRPSPSPPRPNLNPTTTLTTPSPLPLLPSLRSFSQTGRRYHQPHERAQDREVGHQHLRRRVRRQAHPSVQGVGAVDRAVARYFQGEFSGVWLVLWGWRCREGERGREGRGAKDRLGC